MSEVRETVAAVMMVRNEQHVIASCIGHLLNTVRVDRVYVIDNGSTDRTLPIMEKIARATGRVVVETDPGEFRQGDILTALAQRAAREGADWVLPSDADEFLWLRPGVSLASLCGRGDIDGYRMRVCNFLQARPVQRDWPGSLATMCVAAIPSGELEEVWAMVEAGQIPFAQGAYPTKLLVRARPSLQITFGHHDAHGLDAPLAALDAGEVLHAPIRSFDDLQHRAEAGRRVAVVTPEPNMNWHLKRIAAMGAHDLAVEWRANSFNPLRPARAGATRLDWRLARVAWQQRAFRRAVHRSL